MKDTPGWASPGSAPSDGQETGASGPADAAGRPDPAQPAQPADQPDTQPQSPGVKWSKEQPPPGQWSAPTGAPAPGQAPPPPPPPGPGWGTAPPPGGYGGPGGGGWGGPGHGAPGYGGPGYGGPGGYGAWGGGWGGPPPAAKPGVIPLRPLGVGEILDGAVSMMRTHWRTVLGISLVVAVITEIMTILVQRLALQNTVDSDALDDPNAAPRELFRAMGNALLGSGVLFVVSLVGTVLATALLTTVTSRAVLGRQVTVREAWRDARPQVLRLAGLILLLLLIGIGVLAVGMLPGILVATSGSPVGGTALAVLGALAGGVVAVWLAVRFSLASPALMLEKQGIKKAMTRSAKLVRGSWWRVFGIQLLAALIVGIISAIIVIPFGLIAAAFSDGGLSGLLDGSTDLGWTYLIISGIGSVIGSLIKFPISAGVTVLLYIDQRIRREALDLELGRAAGIQGPGSGTPASGS
ncbi:glycerophosphoryl diester phosphodiesterase membrane domain-containing protein [Streptomyces sp. MK5]|uniref:glycerophosphoryl diester phosphodiesterase membrane domain-containing protein n=1 Tax=Streptomyces sp. MK5 TaxID=3064253 RepID=UPI002742598C|nr:glycerophosphoryl diester phosphodiesterase membrane domain-containing protein [Streptomyces sp. MK5]